MIEEKRKLNKKTLQEIEQARKRIKEEKFISHDEVKKRYNL